MTAFLLVLAAVLVWGVGWTLALDRRYGGRFESHAAAGGLLSVPADRIPSDTVGRHAAGLP